MTERQLEESDEIFRNFGTYDRLTPGAERINDRIEVMTSARKAFKLLATLVGRTTVDSLKVVEYDSKTGEPKYYDWMPFQRPWDGKLWLDGGGSSEILINMESPLYNAIQAELPEGDVMVIEVEGKLFTVTRDFPGDYRPCVHIRESV